MFNERHSQRSPSGTATRSPASVPNCAQSGRVVAARQRQKGVALLMTLGVLALLLILAMSFAFNARTERMASAINADMIRARLLCESGLERAMAYLGKSNDYPTTTAAADLFPATKPGGLFFAGTAGDWIGRYYAVSMQAVPDQLRVDSALVVNLGGYVAGSWVDFYFTPASPQLHAKQSWHPVKADGNGDGDTTDPDDPLIGRIAFLVIDESGKIDPSAVITPVAEPFSDTDNSGAQNDPEHYFDIDGNGSWTNAAVAESTEKRGGGSPQEINGEKAFAPTAITPGGLVSGLLANTPRWLSWRHLRQGVTGMTDAIAKEAVKSVFPFSYDIEAFLDGSTDKHRFNLAPAPADWDAFTLVTLKAAASDFWTDATRTVVAPNTGGIPWLTAAVASDGATNLADQIGANLKDYGDSDSVATTVNYVPAAGDWVGGRTLAAADAVGLEKVPYINEIAITATLTNNAFTSTTTLAITVNVELVNIYDISAGGNLVIDLAFAGIPGAAVPNGATASPAGATLTWAAVSVPANSYGYPTNTVIYSWPDAGPGTGLAGFTVTGISVTLTDGGGNLLDLARIDGATAAPIAIAGFTYGDVEVVDPRCNTSGTGGGANWQWNGGGFSPVVPSSVGSKNSVSDPSSAGSDSKDAETVADPADPGAKVGMSTAYIRNAPMKSLWELGCIHRGEPWRTLRLAKYNASSPLVYSYANGDANLLDQVKLGPYTVVDGKFNANSPQPVAWRAALQGIVVGAVGTSPTNHGYDAPFTPGVTLSLANADMMIPNPAAATAGTILASNGTKGGVAGANRGVIAAAAKLSDGTVVAQTTDRAKEEIIGKLANLLTVRQNYFTVVVTAQAVKDLGTLNVAQTGLVAWNDNGTTKYCQVLAEQKILAIVYRDAFTNRFRVDRFEYLEE